MPSEPAIRVAGVGKKYRIHHKAGGSAGAAAPADGYRRFSEEIADWAAKPFRSVARSLSGIAGRKGRESAAAGEARSYHEDFWALTDIGFDVQPGEVVGIVGRNGAGKSTLLKILSRITEPTTGRIELNGRVASLLEVGTGFHPELTGRENIYLNGSILGMARREIESKFDEIVDFAEIERFLDTPVKRYSSGMYVRLAFAVAAHLDPEILVVDEVLAVGDAEFQRKCIGKLSDVASGGRTVLFVSHNLATVESLCTRGIVIESGNVVADDTVRRAITRYLESSDESQNLAETFSPAEGPLIESIALKAATDSSLPELGGGFEIELQLRPEANLNLFEIGLQVRDERKTRVMTLHTRLQPVAFKEDPDRRTVRCAVNDCRLIPGRYSIDLVVAARGQNLQKNSDCLTFDLIPSDVYRTGKLPERKNGLYVPDAAWDLV